MKTMGFFLAIFFASAPVQAVQQEGLPYLVEARKRYEEIQSYRCVATNVVMKYGLLQPKRHVNTVEYLFAKPDKVRIHWLEPGLLKGQVAVFRGEELTVKLRLMPFPISMDPDGWLAQDPAGNRIYQTHFGHLLETLLEAVDADTAVTLQQEAPEKELRRVIIENAAGKVMVDLDVRLGLPVSVEYYDPEGRLQQAAYFKEIVLDVEIAPETFDLSAENS